MTERMNQTLCMLLPLALTAEALMSSIPLILTRRDRCIRRAAKKGRVAEGTVSGFRKLPEAGEYAYLITYIYTAEGKSYEKTMVCGNVAYSKGRIKIYYRKYFPSASWYIGEKMDNGGLVSWAILLSIAAGLILYIILQ